MGDIFLKTLNMSIAAGWLILAVVLLRFVLKKAPKWIAVLLWGLVALRLAVPFSFESALSLIPSAETFNAHNIQYETPAIRSGIPAVNNAVNPVLGESFAPNPAGSVNPLYVWTWIVSVIWLIGIAAMLLYAMISYVRVRRSVAERVPFNGNSFLCDHVRSPFILGLVRPKIYLPSGMDTAAMEPVIAHEQAHLARHDHWWKPLGFLILTVHWFNPLCWLAYALLCRDIELACDERVIRQMDLDGKKQYSTALLACSTQRRLVSICPLAFGEIGVKERVKNVLHYKKPAFWLMVVAVAACAVVTVCFATNPKQALPQAQSMDALRDKYPEYFDLGTYKGLELYVWQMAENDYRFGLMAGTNREKALEELLSLKGASAEEMALILSTYDIEDKHIFLIPWGNPASSYMITEEMVKAPEYSNNIRAMLGLEGASESSVEIIDDKIDLLDSYPRFDVQFMISTEILRHHRSEDRAGFVSGASFVELAALRDTAIQEGGTHHITYYGWSLYEEYRVADDGLELVSGHYTPLAVTYSFDLDELDVYMLTEYWEPRDGSYYAQDIREKFPAHIVEDAMDGQKFRLQLEQACYIQALSFADLDPEKLIETLLAAICSSPAQSSLPGDYIKEHPAEYRELTYYGRYTLQYCFARFEAGGETGLAGRIMMRACEDIAAGWGEEPLVFFWPYGVTPTGQTWYDAFKNNALGLMEQYSEMALAERWPASYLLLKWLGKI